MPRRDVFAVLLMRARSAVKLVCGVLMLVVLLFATPARAESPDMVRGILSPTDLEQRREAVARYVYGAPGRPSALPTVAVGVGPAALSGLANVARVDRFQHTMGAVTATSYVLRPRVSNRRLIVMHYGHGALLEAFLDPVRQFASWGYTVVAMDMPGFGFNARPELGAWPHDHVLADPQGMRLRTFIEPVTVALNELERESWRSVSMLGVSGGGWTTVVAAAVDWRIALSYPVAGSLPHDLRTVRDGGDAEQNDFQLMGIADYRTLYAMGAHRRVQTHVFNVQDPCCFAGVEALSYELDVRVALWRSGGGEFSVVFDNENKQHTVSQAMMELIDRETAVYDSPMIATTR